MPNAIIRTFLVIFLICLAVVITLSQSNFSTFYYANDPAIDSTDFRIKKSIHKNYIAKQEISKDSVRQILGHMYIANDHFVLSEYDSANIHLNKALDRAKTINHTLLVGRVLHKKAAIYATLDLYEDAVKTYNEALTHNEIAKDSVYIAITLEQLATNNSNLKKYNISNAYFEKAIPLVYKYAKPSSISTTLINYGNSLSNQNKLNEAILQYKKAIQIGEEIEDDYEIIPAKQNLALVYYKMDSLDKALQLFKFCKSVNEERDWLDFLIYSYDGLSITHQKLGNLDSALYYNQKYHTLKDSVLGTEMKLKISTLENNLRIKEIDNSLLKEQNKLIHYKRNALIIFLSIVFLSGMLLIYYYNKLTTNKKLQKESQQTLRNLTRLLENKNQELRSLKENKLSNLESTREDLNVYDLNILTNDDWQSFKLYFEKSYPNYINKVRKKFPSITEAEERLFLFIKLKLTTKETADILGVKSDSIKKGRTRLRKRLELNEDQNLEKFIDEFQ